MITPEQLIDFTDATGDNVATQADMALTAAEGLVGAYTRGRHKRDGDYREGVEAVVLTVAARILANPEQIQVREQVGPYSFLKGEGFSGFTLVERAVLDRYRKTAR